MTTLGRLKSIAVTVVYHASYCKWHTVSSARLRSTCENQGSWLILGHQSFHVMRNHLWTLVRHDFLDCIWNALAICDAKQLHISRLERNQVSGLQMWDLQLVTLDDSKVNQVIYASCKCWLHHVRVSICKHAYILDKHSLKLASVAQKSFWQIDKNSMGNT